MKFFALLFLSTLAFAHKGEKHGPNEVKAPVVIDEETLQEVRADYEAGIKPIFQRACFDCHGNTTKYPWYYKIPGVKQMIDHDVEEAKEHMDMSEGWPFKGHGSPTEDLEAIIETVKDGEMPPLKYKIMHPSSKLSDAEKSAIRDWAGNALIFL